MRLSTFFCLAGFAAGTLTSALAAEELLPAPADASRIKVQPRQELTLPQPPMFDAPSQKVVATAPAEAQNVVFTLNRVVIEGATHYENDKLQALYQDLIGQRITLDQAWHIAGRITQLYRGDGYFLTRAFVPAQTIDEGVLHLSVAEGYIHQVLFDENSLYGDNKIIKQMVADLTSQKPISAKALESFMLRLDDMPEVSFRAVVEPATGVKNAAILVLKEDASPPVTSIGMNNSGSRYLGPYQANVTHERSLLPNHKTALTLTGSVPEDELKAVGLQHTIQLDPEVSLMLSGSHASARPGYILASRDITSNSTRLSGELKWQPLRQRQENFFVSLGLESLNSSGDILGDTPLTRDQVRTSRLRLNYDTSDALDGYHYFNLVLSQGLDLLGSSKAGQANLSRAEAKPDFSIANMDYAYITDIASSWLLIGQIAGQIASGPLYSSEEFGYGGSVFGRAYDPSEITGDHGIIGMVELRYTNLHHLTEALRAVPYVYYDAGKTWNDDTDSSSASASSAGAGLYFVHDSGISATFGIALPLAKPIDTPIYGNGKNPRINLSLQYRF